MKIIYVAGPYSASTPEGIETNCWLARSAGVRLAEIPGAFPLIPHQLGRGIEQIGDYAYWIAATLEVMRRCDAVYAMLHHAASAGATAEIAEAKRVGLPVFYCVEDVAAWMAVPHAS